MERRRDLPEDRKDAAPRQERRPNALLEPAMAGLAAGNPSMIGVTSHLRISVVNRKAFTHRIVAQSIYRVEVQEPVLTSLRRNTQLPDGRVELEAEHGSLDYKCFETIVIETSAESRIRLGINPVQTKSS
jgi:hypothetical protein